MPHVTSSYPSSIHPYPSLYLSAPPLLVPLFQGASMDNIMFTIVGQITQRIVAKYPMLTMRMMIRGVVSLGRGDYDPFPLCRALV